MSNGILIPYLDLDFDLSCLTGIMFSPTMNDELAKDSIIDYCHYISYNLSIASGLSSFVHYVR